MLISKLQHHRGLQTVPAVRDACVRILPLYEAMHNIDFMSHITLVSYGGGEMETK